MSERGGVVYKGLQKGTKKCLIENTSVIDRGFFTIGEEGISKVSLLMRV